MIGPDNWSDTSYLRLGYKDLVEMGVDKYEWLELLPNKSNVVFLEVSWFLLGQEVWHTAQTLF